MKIRIDITPCPHCGEPTRIFLIVNANEETENTEAFVECLVCKTRTHSVIMSDEHVACRVAEMEWKELRSFFPKDLVYDGKRKEDETDIR